MTLRPLSDVGPADWFVDSDAPWHVKVGLGPPGFEAYARVLYDLDEEAPVDSDERLHIRLREILGRHTSTPDACYVGLWDGYGDIDAAWYAETTNGSLTMRSFSAVRTPGARRVAPGFPQSFLDGPMVRVPARNYYLFTGPLSQAADWGAADYAPGMPRDDMSQPNLLWPADHTWFLASDVDPDWIGVGGSQTLIDELLADPHFDAAPAIYGPEHPETR